MKSRRERLISLTSNGEISIATLARVIGCPEASIRRSLQELRADGYNITFTVGGCLANYGSLRTVAIAEPSDKRVS